MALILTGTSSSTTLDSSAGLTFSDSSNQSAAASPYGLKNRIINGDMVINQRNLGTVNPVSGDALKYTIDRFWVYNSNAASKFSIQQSSTAPAGFINSVLITVTNAVTITSGDEFTIGQYIEGVNIADLNWGTANAQTVTLSFWVRSSVTGTFGGSLVNSAYNRSYPFSYTISAANTWEKETITIAGDTSGTWLTTNGVGIRLQLSLGVGSTKTTTAGAWTAGEYYNSTGSVNLVATNGATFYITGVQLERNTTATPFEWLPYSTELALCQRYYAQADSIVWTNCATALFNGMTYTFKSSMRSAPTITAFSTNTNTSGKIYYQDAGTDVNSRIANSTIDGVYVGVSNTSTNSGSNMFFKMTANSEL